MAEIENNEEIKAPSNFIHDFIDEDLADGKYSKIQTRFPPEPNGYLHIGHAKAICINFGVKEKYKGVCNLRLDDTNPTKEDTEYVDAIKEDIKWLGFDWGASEQSSLSVMLPVHTGFTLAPSICIRSTLVC